MSAVAGDGEHVWSYVRLTVSRPWFFVVYTLHTEEGDLGDQLLLSVPEQVADMFRRNGNEITVNQLMLVSPHHLNCSEHWLMEPIAQIWRGKRGTRTVFVYRLADGREYLDDTNPAGRHKLAEMAR